MNNVDQSRVSKENIETTKQKSEWSIFVVLSAFDQPESLQSISMYSQEFLFKFDYV